MSFFCLFIFIDFCFLGILSGFFGFVPPPPHPWRQCQSSIRGNKYERKYLLMNFEVFLGFLVLNGPPIPSMSKFPSGENTENKSFFDSFLWFLWKRKIEKCIKMITSCSIASCTSVEPARKPGGTSTRSTSSEPSHVHTYSLFLVAARSPQSHGCSIYFWWDYDYRLRPPLVLCASVHGQQPRWRRRR